MTRDKPSKLEAEEPPDVPNVFCFVCKTKTKWKYIGDQQQGLKGDARTQYRHVYNCYECGDTRQMGEIMTRQQEANDSRSVETW